MGFLSTTWGLLMAFLGGGAIVWAAIISGLFKKKESDATAKKTNVEASAGEQRLVEDRIEFLTKQAEAYRKLYEDVSEKYMLSERLSATREKECDRKIEAMQLQIQQLQEKVTILTTQIGLK